MEVKIDLLKSITENADMYYKKGKKAKSKISGAREALEKTEKRLSDLEDEKTVLEKPLRKKGGIEKKWYEKFRWFYSSDGFFVIGGRDATTNEILIKKYTEKFDLVFHADVHGAPFFVIKNPDNKNIPEQTRIETAIASASYSKAWTIGLGRCDVYYVTPEQVSKTAESGEYLSKGAFVIRGKKSWFRHTKLEISIGVKVNEETKIIGGPTEAVKKHSDFSVRLAPGDKKSGGLAKEIKDLMLKKIGGMVLDVEQIQRAIPGGRGMVVK